MEKNASCPKRTATVELTQAKVPDLKHGRFADIVSKSHSVGYESIQYPSDLAVSMELKRKSRRFLSLHDIELESRTSSFVSGLLFNFIQGGRKENLFFTAEQVTVLRKNT